MSVNDDEKGSGQLRKLNEELTESLAQCRRLLDQCRSKLAANLNDPHLPEEDEDTRLA